MGPIRSSSDPHEGEAGGLHDEHNRGEALGPAVGGRGACGAALDEDGDVLDGEGEGAEDGGGEPGEGREVAVVEAGGEHDRQGEGDVEDGEGAQGSAGAVLTEDADARGGDA